MDGASKFVRGDAIAGLLVVFINVIGGMIIGIAQQGLSFAEAAHSYTILTVGDGLVTQVPALIVSTAAGLLGLQSRRHRRRAQGAARPALRLSQGARHVGRGHAGDGAAARHPDAALPRARRRRHRARLHHRQAQQARGHHRSQEGGNRRQAQPAEEPIASALKIDDLKVELGYALLPLVNSPDGTDRLTEQIKALRRSLADRDGLRHAGGAHPRQCAARGQRLRHQDQGGGGRHRQAVGRPVHGHGPGRRPGEPARHPHHRADLRAAGDLDRGRAQRGRHA